MAMQLTIDDALIKEACILGHFETVEDAVVNALLEFINRRKTPSVLENNGGIILGVMEGKLSVPANFDNELPRHIENEFYSVTL